MQSIQERPNNNGGSTINSCRHCGLPVPPYMNLSSFCCMGCENVWNFLIASGLEDFYEIRARSQFAPARPALVKAERYGYLDDLAFKELYVKTISANELGITFYLEGIHCAACVWLLERLPSLASGVVNIQVDLGRQTAFVVYGSDAKLSQIAQIIQSLGYVPHPVSGSNRELIRRRAERMMLIRIGVAAVCAMNTMLLATSLYQGWFSGIEAEYSNYFSVVSLLLSVPAVLFSAWPIYRTAIAGLHRRILHIDVPLSVAILLAFALSVFNTARGNLEVYYDTLTTLIFLLLVARFLQQRGLSLAHDRAGLFSALSPLEARRIRGEIEEEVYVGSLVPGDIVRVGEMGRIPADGNVISGVSAVDESLLSGEMRHQTVRMGSPVYAGSTNIQMPIVIEVTKAHSDSRVGKLLQVLENTDIHRAHLVELTDTLSAYFVGATLGLALISGSIWWYVSSPTAALNVVLSLLVVSCPCALGLAGPLAMSAATRGAAQRGIFVKRARALEAVARGKRVLFDKTGTLTEGAMSVSQMWVKRDTTLTDVLHAELTTEEQRFLTYAAYLEEATLHPVGKAIHAACAKQHTSAQSGLHFSTREEPGFGVLGIHDGKEWRIGSIRWLSEHSSAIAEEIAEKMKGQTCAVLTEDRRFCCLFVLQDQIREGMREALDALRSEGRTLEMLSGDDAGVALQVGEALGFAPAEVHGNCSPEEKLEFVQKCEALEPVVMIGDGINDLGAMHAATASVAILRGAEATLEIADIALSPYSAAQVKLLFQGARNMIALIRVNFAISLVYNAFAASAAVCGLVSPLLAAVIMPLSSLTVALTTLGIQTFQPNEPRQVEKGMWK